MFFPMDFHNSIWDFSRFSFLFCRFSKFCFCLSFSLIKFDVLIFQLFLYRCTKAISPKWAGMHKANGEHACACTCMLREEYRLTKQWISHEPNRTLTIKWFISSKTLPRPLPFPPFPFLSLSLSFSLLFRLHSVCEIEKTITQRDRKTKRKQ